LTTDARSTDALIVGGGAFGAWLALLLRRDHGCKVVLLEREQELCRRASYNNQARVHNGYHYPRSILTGLRSRVNSARFLVEFADCIDSGFQMYYGIGRVRSNVTPAQFETFCQRIGAPLAPPEGRIAKLFDPALVAALYKAEEHAFDAEKLTSKLRAALEDAAVEIRLGTEALRVEPGPGGRKRLRVQARERASGEELAFDAAWVFNCTYSNINTLLANSGLEKIPLVQELAELALVDVGPELANIGVTIMCGPFFSFMPFPPLGLHSFSHVRYTPNHAWLDRGVALDNQQYLERVPKRSQWDSMRRDSARYMPVVESFTQKGSLWELKTVLPQSASDDSRPILFKRDAGLAGLTCVLGGKIDNMYDMERELGLLLAERPAWA